MDSLREQLAALIKPQLPKRWRVVPYSTALDAITQPVVMIYLKSIRRLPAAPNGAHLNEFTILVIEPKIEPGPADEALDDEVDTLIHALDGVKNLTWISAERGTFADSYPSFEISVELTSTKEQ